MDWSIDWVEAAQSKIGGDYPRVSGLDNLTLVATSVETERVRVCLYMHEIERD
jgi:hypothetical protein